jgi:heterodisulfide reductase subunit D
MGEANFETALSDRINEMVDSCTACGKCVESCPSVAPAGIAQVPPTAVITGVLDILRSGEGPEASRLWAQSCTLSGECLKACTYGVNPRFLLAMARVSLLKTQRALSERRRDGVARYRDTSRDVAVLSRLQLEGTVLDRLGQRAQSVAKPGEAPQFVFYTGCNVLKTPHIALLALDVMDKLGITYQVMGGPSHCCGIQQMRTGDMEMSGRLGANSIEKMSHSKSGQVLAWCPSCQVQFTETTLPVIERLRGSKPFEMIPFIRFLRSQLDHLKPHLVERVALQVALHKHPGVAGVVEAAAEILQAIPGVELVDLQQPAVGLQSVNLSALPAYKRELQRNELEAARRAGIDALVAVYHSDHRELCAHERDWPFRIVNLLELVGQSMGLHQHDRFKELKLMQDADLIVADCHDLIVEHEIDVKLARAVVVNAMLGEQPLPLHARPPAPMSSTGGAATARNSGAAPDGG